MNYMPNFFLGPDSRTIGLTKITQTNAMIARRRTSPTFDQKKMNKPDTHLRRVLLYWLWLEISCQTANGNKYYSFILSHCVIDTKYPPTSWVISLHRKTNWPPLVGSTFSTIFFHPISITHLLHPFRSNS